MPKSKDLKVSVSRPLKKQQSFFEKVQSDLQNNQNYLNLILGGLIVVIIGVLLFNYFNRPSQDIGPSQQTQEKQAQTQDVEKNQLPGKYTVKEGDTLYLIAEKYYDDGFKYAEIVKANNLTNENNIEVGQILDLPKLEQTSQTAESSPSPENSPSPSSVAESDDKGTGGAENQTIWGEKITGDTYTIQPDDWLSKIAGRAYGDVMAYDKIAQANNIQNPDLIEPGVVLKIPR